MLKLSKLSDYAVVVLSHLSRERGQVMSSVELAQSTGLPEPTVSKVLKVLSKGGMVTSSRGASGGYKMERSPDQVSVRELITALEGPIAVTACLEENNNDCSVGHMCQMRGRWQMVNQAIMSTLDDIALSELLIPAKTVKNKNMEPA